MIMMTLNCRGLASIPKKLVVCRLVADQLIDVLFLQETMADGFIFAGEMETLLNRWSFVSVDSKGKLGSLLLGWSSRYF